MPTNLPTGGTYGKSQAAADAYNAWKTNLTETCSNGIRVKFDDNTSTVSEGIAYGMLLAAYAADKATFDGLWKYYRANVNGNGVMNWKIGGCTGVTGANGATDAELDAAMALIIASEQWPTATNPYTYKNEALYLIGKIRQYEIHSTTYQVLNGDAWGTGSTCRNPSYMAPAYFREFAKVETAQASFWNSATSTANSFLLTNRNSTTGLVSNWADNNATPNTCNGSNEFGWDAIRNPWRMAKDYIWNGASTATTAADICGKMSAWANNYASNLKGPCALNAANPSVGQYKNGTFGMIGLAFMGTSGTTYQTALNTAYTNIVGLGNNEAYFSQTLRCITLFMMTGNFWKPGTVVAANPLVTAATTNTAGSKITLTFNKTMATPAAAAYSAFTLRVNGSTVVNAFSAIALNGTSSIDLTLSSPVSLGDVITISYTPGTIQSADANVLEAFTNQSVTNAISGGNTLIADCEDVNQTKLLTFWYSYKTGSSTITPLSSTTSPFTMTLGGANGTDSAAIVTGQLVNPGAPSYESCGIGFAMKDPEANYDLTGATGISFWHKGDAIVFNVILDDAYIKNNAGYDYAISVNAHANWTLVEVPFTNMSQPSWMTTGDATAVANVKPFDASKVTKLQWQIKDGTARSFNYGIDEVTVMGKVLNLPTQTTIDKSLLASAITSATAIHNAAIEGTAVGQYPVGSKATLLNAITAAQTVYNNVSATQTQVDNAKTTLDAAVATFQASVITSVSTNTLIADCEDGNQTKLLTFWYSYNDAAPGGSSIVTPLSTQTSPFTMSLGGANGTDSAAKITYTLMGAAQLGYDPFVGFGFALKNPEAAYDLSGSTGISFYHKGDAVALEVGLSTNTDSDFYTAQISSHANWTLVTIPWTSFAQSPYWGNDVPWDASKVVKFQWKKQAADGTSGTIWIDEVRIDGKVLNLPTQTVVNKDALTAKIAEANTTLSVNNSKIKTNPGVGEYPLSAGMALQNAIAAAEAVNNNTAATQTQVDNATTTLNTAIQTFLASVVTSVAVDKSLLASSLSTAQSIYNTATEGTAVGNYPVGSKATLLNAITAAQTVYNNTSATQTQVDNAKTTLDAAVATFQASIITNTVSKTALQTSIATGNNLYVNSIEGTAVGQYPAGSRNTLLLAINAAQAVYTNTSATQIQVDNAKATLDAAIVTFQNSQITSVVVNKSTLVSTISYATGIYNSAVEGTANGQYPVGSKTTLMNAITAAQAINNNTSATQLQVDNAVSTLNTAVTTFLNSVNGINTSTLQDKIDQATSTLLLATNNTGNQPGNYPFSSVTALNNAITVAQNVLNTATTQVQITDAVNTLQNEITSFLNSVVPYPVNVATLQDLIDIAEAKIATAQIGNQIGQYPANTFNALYAELITANTLMLNPNATQTDIDAQVVTLQNVYNAFLASVRTNIEVVEQTNCIVNANNQMVMLESHEVIKQVVITTVLGTTTTLLVNEKSAQVSVESIAKGVYFVTVVFANGTQQTIRLVKK
jgi:endo-1,4-beta-D-glucanase Y